MKSGKRRNRTRQEPSPVDPDRHQRCCRICHHPDREFIELDFLRWRSPDQIAHEHNISGRACIYRDARATGLLALRRRNAWAALEPLMERAEEAVVSGNCVVAAVRLYALINDDGKLVQPPKSVHVTHSSSAPPNPELGKPAEASEPERPARPPKLPGARQARKPKAAREGTQPDARRERTEPDASREGAAPMKPTPHPTPTVSTAGYDPAPMVSHPFVPVYPEPGRSPGRRKP